jgi:hypothetical protein
MAQDSGLAYRGLLLLGMMLILVTLVGFVLFRRPETPPVQNATHRELAALGVAAPGTGFPASIGWGALGTLGEILPDSAGWLVRYNATVALARLGTEAVPFDVMSEMLDEKLQMRNWRFVTADGKVFVDEQAAQRTMLGALEALEEWHKHKQAVDTVGKDNPGLQRVYAAVDRLTHSPSTDIQQRAESVKKKIESGNW